MYACVEASSKIARVRVCVWVGVVECVCMKVVGEGGYSTCLVGKGGEGRVCWGEVNLAMHHVFHLLFPTQTGGASICFQTCLVTSANQSLEKKVTLVT